MSHAGGSSFEVLVSPELDEQLHRLRCARLALSEGASTELLTYQGREALYYCVSGFGVFGAQAAEAEWPYGLQSGHFAWLGPDVGHHLANAGEGDLRIVRFDWPAETGEVSPGMGRLLRRAEDYPVEEEGGRAVTVVFRGPGPQGGRIVTVERATYFPGGFSPIHRAEGLEEIFYFLRGKGVVLVGDREVAVQAGSAVAIPSGVRHNVRNVGQTVLEHVTCNIRM